MFFDFDGIGFNKCIECKVSGEGEPHCKMYDASGKDGHWWFFINELIVGKNYEFYVMSMSKNKKWTFLLTELKQN